MNEEVLAIREEVLGSGHPDVADALNNLATVMSALGDLEAARGLYERSLAVRKDAYGPDHPIVDHSMNNLAILLMDEARRRTGEARAWEWAGFISARTTC